MFELGRSLQQPLGRNPALPLSTTTFGSGVMSSSVLKVRGQRQRDISTENHSV